MSRNIVLASIGTDGDVLPFLHIGERLRQRGHRVTLCVNEEFEDRARERGLGFASLISTAEMTEVLSNADFWHPWKSGLVAAAWGGRLMKGQYELLRDLTREPGSLLVSTLGILPARLVREKEGTPFVSYCLQPGLLPSVYDSPKIAALPWFPNRAPRFVKAGIYRGIDVLGDKLVGGDLNELRRSLGLGPIKRIFRWWFSPDLVLAGFPSWFAARQPDWPAPFEFVGFPRAISTASLDGELLDFLARGEPPIAFTFGTGMMHAQELYRAAIDACSLLGARALFLTRHRAQLPASLPDSVRVVPFAPFDALFPRCRAIVHHGGVGTAAQSLAAGVPQLIRPFAWDQQDNAMRLSRLGVGAALAGKSFHAARIARAIEALSHETVRDRCRETADRFEGSDPLEEAAKQIEAVRTRG